MARIVRIKAVEIDREHTVGFYLAGSPPALREIDLTYDEAVAIQEALRQGSEEVGVERPD